MARISAYGIISCLVMAAAFAAVIFWSHSAVAEGALAIGAPVDVAKEGYASGYSYNAKTKWPAPVIRLYLGQTTSAAVLAAADDPAADVKQRRLCDANFFIGELALQQGSKE